MDDSWLGTPDPADFWKDSACDSDSWKDPTTRAKDSMALMLKYIEAAMGLQSRELLDKIKLNNAGTGLATLIDEHLAPRINEDKRMGGDEYPDYGRPP